MKEVKYNEILKGDNLSHKMTVAEVREYLREHGEINILAGFILECLEELRCDFAEYRGYKFSIRYADDAPIGRFNEYYHIEIMK